MQERAGSTHKPISPQAISWHLPRLLDDRRDHLRQFRHGDDVAGAHGAARRATLLVQRHDVLDDGGAALLDRRRDGVPRPPGGRIYGDGSFDDDDGRFRDARPPYDLPVKVVVIKNNTLGLIKWEQMLYLGNPEYGVDLHPIDFVKVAEACGARGVRIDDPEHCRDQLKEALALPGPALIECVVDPLEPPWPPVITNDEQKKLAAAMARGEINRTPIGLSIGRHAVQEFSFSQSPFGAVGRLVDRVTGRGDKE